MSQSISAICPSCDTRIYFHRQPKLRDIVGCHECGDQFAVVNLSPLRLEWSFLDDNQEWSDNTYDDYHDYRNGQQDQYDY